MSQQLVDVFRVKAFEVWRAVSLLSYTTSCQPSVFSVENQLSLSLTGGP